MSKKDVGWNFDNTYIQLPESLFSRVNPSLSPEPKIILLNEKLAINLGLNLSEIAPDKAAVLFSGNILPLGAEPIAQAYAGHQFGYFNLLGDGRAILLGEQITPKNQRFDIQFKGAGRTPYSRQGDGKAALEPMLREYVISEAMYALGIPTTRSLAVVITGEKVLREKFLPGAILTRVAASHIRVGTFEYIAARGNIQMLKTMVEYVINRHYPHLKHSENLALELLKTVIESQAKLIVQWIRVGFIHGVMNTDNMAISGETIDYGPCAFMDVYDPKTVFSSIDSQGRYAFGNQARIAQWNLARFAETLLPLFDESPEKSVQIATEEINYFPILYHTHWLTMMRKKLGLYGEKSDDEILINDLLSWMQNNHADYTNTFRALENKDFPVEKIFQKDSFKNWYKRWTTRLSQNNKPLKSAFELMCNNNPAVIPRNHKVEEALKAAANDDFSLLQRLLSILATPYNNDQQDLGDYQLAPQPSSTPYKTFCGT